MTLQPGAVLNQRYRVVKLLQQGGFGAIYRAWDTVLGRPCAVKENLNTAPEAERQFEREAKILAGLTHPNLPRVSDHFFVPAQGQYLVMDLVEGQDLQAMLEEVGGPLPEDWVLDWASQVCDALIYMHAHNPPVIHRDIKPANIRVTPGGLAMLVDFGIAKMYDPGLKTTVGARAVTPGYSPHEQYGRGTTDARTDIYALGATLYTLLTGVEPEESIQRVVHDPLVSPEVLNPGISPGAAAVVMRAMQVDADQRFQSAIEMKSALLASRVSGSAIPANMVVSAPGGAAASVGGRILPLWGWAGVIVVLTVLFVIFGLALSGDLPWGKAGPATFAAVATETWFRAGVTPSPGTPAVLDATVSPTRTVASTPDDLPTSTPVPTLPPTPLPLIYLVEAGDTCSAIAVRFGVSMNDIAQYNNLAAGCEKILVGDKLSIPYPENQVDSSAMRRRVAEKDKMEMVYIPAGLFQMGSVSLDANANEKPRRVVAVDAFWIDRTEVTNRMYALCVSAGDCKAPEAHGSKTRPVYFGASDFGDFPMINVSWQAANDYCQWAGRRLPSEAEWEKAARGVDGRTFPWGETPPSRSLLNYDNQVGDTVQVGNYPEGASPYGLLDMAGNVAEWVADWYAADTYTSGEAVNPLGPASGQLRVLRGGSWFNPQRVVRATFRFFNLPDRGYDIAGFRCAESP